MELFALGNSKFNRLIQDLVQKADNVDFFDKLLRDHMISTLKNERKEQEDFLATIEIARKQINNSLTISTIGHDPLMKEPIIEAANYSLEGDGKRLRPIITWVMGVNEYGLNKWLSCHFCDHWNICIRHPSSLMTCHLRIMHPSAGGVQPFIRCITSP